MQKLDYKALSYEDQRRIDTFCEIMATGLYRVMQKEADQNQLVRITPTEVSVEDTPLKKCQGNKFDT